MTDRCTSRLGPWMGMCEEGALDGFVVCYEHATKDALALMVRTLQASSRDASALKEKPCSSE